MLTPILLIMAGLLIGVSVKALGRYIPLPYTVLLFGVGIGLGFLTRLPIGEIASLQQGLDLISEMNPDFILYVFLPVLVFDAAYEMDLHVFRKTLFNASLLAGPGLVFCMLLTAALVMAMYTLFSGTYDPALWTYALMFGGLISATDPVAVVALLQELGTSKRFSTLVDGESLLNDGTGLVCFMMFYSKFAGEGSIDHPLMYFVWVVVASFAIGYLIYQLSILLVRHIREEILQNCIMVAAAYITFMIAQHAFDVSGVIALVVFGHFFAQRGRPHLKPEVNEWMEKFWSFMAYIANTLIFLMVGILIATKVDLNWTMLLGVVLVFIGLNIIRYLMIIVLMPLLRRSGYGLSWRESVILGWGGLRGALGMSMALMVSCNPNIPLEIRHHILVYTAGIVTLTLCINATTSKWLVRKLQLIEKPSVAERHIRYRLLTLIRRADCDILALLRQNPYLECADWKAVESKMITAPETEVGTELLTGEEMLALIRTDVITHMESVANDYYQRGILNFYSYRHIVDSFAVLSDFEGRKPIAADDLRKDVARRQWFVSRRRRLTDACNLCRGYVMLLLDSRAFLEAMRHSEVVELKIEKQTIDTVLAEVDALISEATILLDEQSHLDPQLFAEAVTDKATRMLLAGERAQVEKLVGQGVMSRQTADVLLADIARRQGYEIVG